MASLFGSVATEVGGTVKDIALQGREERMTDEEHQRDLQLQKMRMRHDSDLTDKRISADDRRETRRQDFESTMFDRETEVGVEAAETAHGYDREITGIQEQSDIIQTIISNHMRNQNTRRMSGEGWGINFEDRQTFDPMTGQPVYTEIVNATAPSGRPYRIMGDKAFPAGEQNPQIYPFQSIEQQRQAEQVLYDGGVTVEQFRDDFGYIPSDYIFGKVSREEPQLRSIIEQAVGVLPAWSAPAARQNGGGSKAAPGTSRESREIRDRMENPQSYEGGPEMTPSIEELSEGPARDAHIAAQGGKTNAEIAAEMRTTEGGALSQAAALEQGGQLEQPGGGGNAYGFELDDAGAAGVAEAVSKGMSPKAKALIEQANRYGYGGTN